MSLGRDNYGIVAEKFEKERGKSAIKVKDVMIERDTYICAKESIKRAENRQKVIAEGDFLAGEMSGCLKRYLRV